MIVNVSTDLDIPADLAWQTVKKPETLRYITRGVLGIRPLDDVPDDWGEGLVVRVRLYFFHVIPAWKHEIRVVRLDETAREIYTNERGGGVRSWNHLIKIERISERRSRYTDRIEIHAGPATPLVWAYAHLFYRYRQHRWRKLARNLASSESPQASGRT